MLQIDKVSKKPYYVQVYEYFKAEIESGRMRAGTKLPSIRALAMRVGISKLTVERAYFQLSNEGYIQGRSKARFEAAFLGDKETAVRGFQVCPVEEKRRILYDFTSGDAGAEGFPLVLWRRYMHRVLSEPVMLNEAQDEQGVPALREALSRYVYETRGVYTDKEHIVIGSGVTALLRILGYLLKQKGASNIAVEEPGFRLARELFRSGGYTVYPVPVGDDGIDESKLVASATNMVYVTPSHQFPTGSVMPVARRRGLLRWAAARDGLIIEDDYDSELRYEGRPVPALKSTDETNRVVYLGSLSKVLPFFVRISYMILPDELIYAYRHEQELFRQSVSVPEQCVVAEYIRSGEMAKQTRRLRRLYQEKGRQTETLLKKYFGPRAEVNRTGSGVRLRLAFESSLSEEELTETAILKGCLVKPMKSFYEIYSEGTKKVFFLSFARIREADLEDAVRTLHEAWTAEGVTHG